MRVHELAKKEGISSKDMVDRLIEMGFEIKTHSSGMTEQMVEDYYADMELTREDDEEAPAEEVAEPEAEAAPEPQPEPEATETAEAEEEAPAEPETAEEPAVEAEPATESEAGPEEAVEGDEPGEAVEGEAATEEEAEPEGDPENLLLLKGVVVVKDLAEMLDIKPNTLIAELMGMNIFASINQKIEYDIARQIGEKHGFIVESEKERKKAEEVVRKHAAAQQKALADKVKHKKEKKQKKSKGKNKGSQVELAEGEQVRPPVVTILGHVDHGKTSLLDNIRKSRVAKREAGGITQHIGAYTIEHKGKPITFLDTPGHAAFTKMRARGANMTDIAIIVIAADEGIMPQTREAIQHAQAADVTIMIALNKMDLSTANPDRVKQQLQQEELTTEDWGGEIIAVEVSAETGAGIDDLMEYITLQSELLELKAEPALNASGYVVEAQMEKGMGATATVLVTNGTLEIGDVVVCGHAWGRMKALISDTGARVKAAGPSFAVKLLGLSDVPHAGDAFEVLVDEKEAKALAEARCEEQRQENLEGPERGTELADLFGDGREELHLLLKTDVQGSLEAIKQSLEEVPSTKVKINFLLTGVGAINENDVLLATASKALVVGFNVKVDSAAEKMAKREGVDIRTYEIIYKLIDDIAAAMEGLLSPEIKETVIGEAEIRAIFALRKKGNVAGCMVTSGKVAARGQARVLRGREVLWSGGITSLKRFQDEAKEVRQGQECGIKLDGFNDFQEGDTIEAFQAEAFAQKL
jgi:translation initiation factor IF-2